MAPKPTPGTRASPPRQHTPRTGLWWRIGLGALIVFGLTLNSMARASQPLIPGHGFSFPPATKEHTP